MFYHLRQPHEAVLFSDTVSPREMKDDIIFMVQYWSVMDPEADVEMRKECYRVGQRSETISYKVFLL